MIKNDKICLNSLYLVSESIIKLNPTDLLFYHINHMWVIQEN